MSGRSIHFVPPISKGAAAWRLDGVARAVSADILILVGLVMYDTEHRCGLICEGWRMKHTFDVWNKDG